ncbi:retrovirus-related pol polyprotein from transposon TNT 1-94 [Tanacetum coccineum]
MFKINNGPTQTRTPQLHPGNRRTNQRVSISTGVNQTTNVSRPQLKSTELRDKVLQNNSEVKNKSMNVEEHRRNVRFLNNSKFVTACNDSLNASTSNVNFLIEIILFIVNFRCSKHMTRNLKLLINFMEKFLGTGNDLLIGNHGSDLYTIDLQESSSLTLICFMDKASSSQAWLWHHRLSHLNFNTISLLSKKNIVKGLAQLKFVKDHLCSSCELGKAKRSTFKSKTTPSSRELGTDKTKITRKPSKMGKHGYENGRVCKSQKPKSEKSTLEEIPSANNSYIVHPSLPFNPQGKTRGFSKLKVQKSNSRVQDQDGKINTSSEVLIGGNPQGECHVNMKKAQRMGIFTLGSLS